MLRSLGRNVSSFALGHTNPVQAFKKGPLLTKLGLTGVGVASTEFLSDSVLGPLAGAIREELTGDNAQMARSRLLMEAQLRKYSESMRKRDEYRQQQTQMNLQQISSFAPDVAQRVLAGRRLTQGGVAIGGRPRTDLLQELASRMTDGTLQ